MDRDRRLDQLAVLPDPSGLLAAIMLNPESDTERLLYADWLDEQAGRATGRAEYIRCFISSRTSTGWELARESARVCELYPILFEPLLIGWAAHPSMENSGSSPHMDRGFLKEIACSWEDWLEYGDDLRKREWVPRVRLTNEVTIETLNVESKAVRFKFTGRPMRTLRETDEVNIDGTTEKEMLEMEWPGTEFELPY